MNQINLRTGILSLLAVVLILSIPFAVSGTVDGRDHTGFPASLSLHSPRVVVLKSKRIMYLFDGERLVRSYPIDLGFEPAGQKQRKDDGRTPLGRFSVVTKNGQSGYHRFIGLDYPDWEATEWGLAAGLISPGEASAIRSALADEQCPDWGTALGGGIGLHGKGRGRDWTGGCVAVADEHIEELFAILRLGDPVEILP